VLNGFEIESPIEEAERVVLAVAAGTLSREQFDRWIRNSLRPLE
jgi:prophage maintenance system killer protein